MQILTDASEHKIIGEAAYALLIRREEINVSTLSAELSRMAEDESDPQRQQTLMLARQWLMKYRLSAEADTRSSSPLRGLAQQDGGFSLPAESPANNNESKEK